MNRYRTRCSWPTTHCPKGAVQRGNHLLRRLSIGCCCWPFTEPHQEDAMRTRHNLNELSFVLMFLLVPTTACFGASGSIFPDSVTPAAEYYDAPNWELGTIFTPTAPGII